MKMLYFCLFLAIIFAFLKDEVSAATIKQYHQVPNYCAFIPPSNKKPNVPDPAVVKSRIILGEELFARERNNIITKLQREVPNFVKSLIVTFLKSQILNHAELYLGRCEEFDDIPAQLKKKYIACGNKYAALVSDYVKNYMRTLTSMPNLIRSLRYKYETCKNHLLKLTANENVLKYSQIENTTETDSTMTSENWRKEENTTSIQETTAYAIGWDVLPEPVDYSPDGKIGKLLRFGEFYLPQVLNNYRIYRLSTVTLNTANLVQDFATDIYKSYNLAQFIKANIGHCTMIELDRFMSDYCDKYVPDDLDYD